jgi:hypothetical protein
MAETPEEQARRIDREIKAEIQRLADIESTRIAREAAEQAAIEARRKAAGNN